MKYWLKKSLWLAGTGLVGAGLATAASQETRAQGIPFAPTPYDLVSNLDLSCHEVKGDPPVRSVVLDHLNPVLQDMGMKEERVELGALRQLCVPVAKNKAVPTDPVLRFVQNVDLACYEAKSELPQQFGLALTQLNPVIQKLGIPDHKVRAVALEQLCVPVAKNGVIPPKDVLQVVQHVDVACYHIELEGLPSIPLHLRHLNPVLQKLGAPEVDVRTESPEQLCVPVAKNGKLPPDDVLKIVQWVDFEKFKVTAWTEVQPIRLRLSHLNPQFAEFKPFEVEMGPVEHLLAPVAKNQKIPPR